jgi:transposase
VSLSQELFPSDLAAAHALLAAERTARQAAEEMAARAQAETAQAQASLTSHEVLVAHLKLMIEKLRRQLYGRRSERQERLLDQLELQLEEVEASATQDALATEAVQPATVRSFTRRRPVRQPFPANIERERVVVPGPSSCPCCGSDALSKLGEDVTETLEEIPRRWKVIETVREKFSCRACQTISQPPAPFHATPRGFIGPRLLARIVYDKFGQHIPLNRQAERFRAEGIDLALSTLADQVGHAAFVGLPVYRLLEAYVLAAARLHGDDTTIPILAKGKTVTGHVWTYVRDDRTFASPDPPASIYYASRDRKGEHPAGHLRTFTGILQADAYSGFNGLYEAGRQLGPVTQALCWAHARRQFFELADIAQNARRGRSATAISPIALEAVKRIDAVFEIERTIKGMTSEERRRVRQDKSAPVVADLEAWLRAQLAGLSRSADVRVPILYMLKRWLAFARFLDDGRICLTNNAAERALRGLALGRKAWLFAGSDRGAERAAIMYSLIMTAKLNDVDPLVWLADVFARIADLPQSRLHELLPWEWKKLRQQPA